MTMTQSPVPTSKPGEQTTKKRQLNLGQTISLIAVAIGGLTLMVGVAGGGDAYPLLFLLSAFGLIAAGGLGHAAATFLTRPPGIRNEYTMSQGLTRRGTIAILIAIVFVTFYIVYYWFDSALTNLNAMMNPLSQMLRRKNASIYFTYAALYTFAILVMGARAFMKYRHSGYHQIRTTVNMGAQLIAAFLIPAFLVAINEPEKYVNYFWPLSQKDLFPSTVDYMLSEEFKLGGFLLFWSAGLSFIGVPVLTYFFGKRWYCSWVCGCGALANTMGDQWRHLSDKRLGAWKFERFSIYSVLLLIAGITAMLWIHELTGGALTESLSTGAKHWYGILIMSVWAGAVGTGFYPILGTRIWCRFGCPLAAMLGILQKFFSRFRITTNGSQCMSCGNCSAYCEMGINVKWYAQRGQNIIRASCVGCGMCAAVCPRGVLSLENGPRNNRYRGTIDLARPTKGRQAP
ncbi:MAG: 4Fe-4S binding protein [Chitinivibrionales bacterium]|nr:4Fe-4S binding protein [Chitinivibrionales bacterium]